MVLHLLTQLALGEPVDRRVMVGGSVLALLLGLLQDHAGEVVEHGRLKAGPLAMARQDSDVPSSGLLGRLVLLGSVLWNALMWTVAFVAGSFMRLYLWMVGARERAPGDAAKTTSKVTEVWFRGNHTDIGGGGNEGLVAASLAWMCQEARQAEPPLVLDDNPPMEPSSPMPDRDAAIGTSLNPFISKNPRPVVAGDRVHASVRIEAGDTTTESLGERIRLNPFAPPLPRKLALLDDRDEPYRRLCGLERQPSADETVDLTEGRVLTQTVSLG